MPKEKVSSSLLHNLTTVGVKRTKSSKHNTSRKEVIKTAKGKKVHKKNEMNKMDSKGKRVNPASAPAKSRAAIKASVKKGQISKNPANKGKKPMLRAEKPIERKAPKPKMTPKAPGAKVCHQSAPKKLQARQNAKKSGPLK